MKYNRASGIIMHPTSFPGPDGIGDLGVEAFRWVDCLAEAGCSIWQVLPLGPTGYGDSPYQSFSAFAGNPYLVSPLLLLDEGLLSTKNFDARPALPADYVDFGPVIQWKLHLLDQAFETFTRKKPKAVSVELEEFRIRNTSWLDDFALFMAIKEERGGGPWNGWPSALRKRQPAAIQDFKLNNQDAVERHIFRQFLFFRQWQAVRDYCRKKGITILGDAPIFVAYDSSDVWANPDLFYLDNQGNPTVVAGVPPDYFSPTGQLWGNPLYRWDVHAAQGYQWWINRLKGTLSQVDLIRLDHFRGFAGYWEIPAGMPTAEVGRWVPGPGNSFFEAVEPALGGLPIVAEDLGEITPDVFKLRDKFKLPGMKIFQFAFASDPHDPFLPHNYPVNCLAYTGTHDNDTTLGWYESSSDQVQDLVRRYLARSGDDIVWDMMRGIWSSTAMISIAPMQDVLGLGTDARMNFPGKPSGNWSWRMAPNAFTDQLIERIKEMNYLYGRLPEIKKPEKK
jgi:4-alpha-glucanotransferase